VFCCCACCVVASCCPCISLLTYWCIHCIRHATCNCWIHYAMLCCDNLALCNAVLRLICFAL
jgi:hypothetical protein